jgi:hypothetical protein
MDKAIETLAGIARTEFDGPSLMGKPFLPYVRSLPFEVVRSNDTYEGYSVWGISLHVLFHKWAMLPIMGGAARPELYPYEQADWPKTPARQDAAAWSELLSNLERTQVAFLEALESMKPERLGEEIPAWSCSVRQALECMACHDLYHVAQIRNMGLKNLPTK